MNNFLNNQDIRACVWMYDEGRFKQAMKMIQ